MLIDAHVHLQDKRFDADRAEMLARARQAGVELFLCNGTCESDWDAVLELARSTHADIVAFFGLHPWYVKSRGTDWADKLEAMLKSMPSGVGEIGLDRWIEDRDDAAQEEVFLMQLSIAQRLNRPASVHCLKAWGPMMELLRGRSGFSTPVLFHAFGGPAELVGELAAMGAYFSFAGSVLRHMHEKMRQSLGQVPLERLLIETDSPDIMVPRSFCDFSVKLADGKERNEPVNVAGVYRGIAALRGMAVDELADVVRHNAARFLQGVKMV